MDTISDLEIIIQRFKKAPLIIARSELEMFKRALEQDPISFAIIQNIILNQQVALGSRASDIINDARHSAWSNLEFANSPELRAAVGYQVLTTLLGSYKEAKAFQDRLVFTGRYYFAHQGTGKQDPSVLDGNKVFSEIFLEPIIIYLKSGLDIEEQILSLLSRYKQRSEWFGIELPGIELPSESGEKDGYNEIEKRLKKDILRFLFDNGVEFSVESQIPTGGGRVDILPIIRDWGQLPIEVKVFDGEMRSPRYVADGLAQIADYARKFNKQTGYYVVFNVKKDSLLLIPGNIIGSNIVTIRVQGVLINSIVCNLNITLPSSDAAKLERVEVPLPD